MSSNIRAILVEDEFKSRSALTKLIDKYCSKIKVVGFAETVKEGIKLIDNLRPDIVFLDVALPDEDGFSVLENVTFKEFEVIAIDIV